MTSETLQSSNISSCLRCGSSAQLVPRASQILQTAGIDMDVLMALPEDMRGEVVLQQIQGMDFSALRAQVRRERLGRNRQRNLGGDSKGSVHGFYRRYMMEIYHG